MYFCILDLEFLYLWFVDNFNVYANIFSVSM